MGYIRIPGLPGRVYVPDDEPGQRKHNCPDCQSCQMCSDSRCGLCLKLKRCKKSGCKRKACPSKKS